MKIKTNIHYSLYPEFKEYLRSKGMNLSDDIISCVESDGHMTLELSEHDVFYLRLMSLEEDFLKTKPIKIVFDEKEYEIYYLQNDTEK